MISETSVGIIFSKNRAMQLDCALTSFSLCCKDIEEMSLKVLYRTSSPLHERQYQRLKEDYRFTEFIQENSFKNDLLSLLSPYEYVLFLVDDTIFVRDFSIGNMVGNLKNSPAALGFSLRLGKNTVYSYMQGKQQQFFPEFYDVGNHTLLYDWTTAVVSFGYPLEVSSSMYRVADLLPQLIQNDFTNPNTLESLLDKNKSVYQNKKNHLFCCETAVAFCNPVNKVQTIYKNNRSGTDDAYSPERLREMFELGYRIDVKRFLNFIPNSCHQEVGFHFIKKDDLRYRGSSLQRWARTDSHS